MRRILFKSILILFATELFLPGSFAQSNTPVAGADSIQRFSIALAGLSRKISPSVVQIRTVGYGAPEDHEVGLVTAEQGTGSGVIVDSTGYIVTNAHVVLGARRVDVWLTDANVGGSSPGTFQPPAFRTTPGKIVGVDPQADLAVLKIEHSGLAPLVFGDSDSLQQGEIVAAFGNPMGLENSVTMGVISSVQRQLKPDDPGIYIQTDAPINPGNSGGALVDVEGRLVGINTFIISQSGGNEGLGFAIPANIVKRIYTELRANGHVHHGQIGAYSLTVTPTLAAGLGLPRDWGVILEDVTPGGPSDQCGLLPGDLLMSADGRIMKDKHQFLMAIDRHAIGESLKVSVLRGAKTIDTEVLVLEQPDDPNRFLDAMAEKAVLVPQLGILALDVTPEMLQTMSGLRKPATVVVAARILGAEGAGNSLAAGDLIVSLNGADVADLQDLRTALNKMSTGSSVVIQVQREDRFLYLAFELP